jgi:hypothetical protein
MEAASNAGIAACDSDYIVIHDDDDSWCPDFLEKTVAFLDGPKGARYGGVTTHSTYVSEEIRGDRVIEHETRPYNDWVRNVQLSEMACGNFFPADRLRVPARRPRPDRRLQRGAAGSRRLVLQPRGSAGGRHRRPARSRWRAITTATGATRPLPPTPIRSSAACRNTRNSPPSRATPFCAGMATGRAWPRPSRWATPSATCATASANKETKACPPVRPMKVCDDRLWCVARTERRAVAARPLAPHPARPADPRRYRLE